MQANLFKENYSISICVIVNIYIRELSNGFE